MCASRIPTGPTADGARPKRQAEQVRSIPPGRVAHAVTDAIDHEGTGTLEPRALSENRGTRGRRQLPHAFPQQRQPSQQGQRCGSGDRQRAVLALHQAGAHGRQGGSTPS